MGSYILVWGSTSNSILRPLQVLQNKIIRIICNVSKNEQVKNNTLYHELKLLKVKDMYHLEIAKFMYFFQHNKLPNLYNQYQNWKMVSAVFVRVAAPRTKSQAQSQDRVIGEAEINFGEAQEVYFCEFERGTGAQVTYPSLEHTNKVTSKKKTIFTEIQTDVSAEIRNSKGFLRPKIGDFQTKKVVTEMQTNFSAGVRN